MDLSTRLEMARNEKTSPQELAQLRTAVARNPKVPNEVLTQLARNEHEWVRQVVAANLPLR